MQKVISIIGCLLLGFQVMRIEAQTMATSRTPLSQKLAECKTVQAGNDWDVDFTLTEIRPGQQVRLSTEARVDWASYGGASYYMVVTVNGVKLPGASLINKAPDMIMRNGMDMPWYQVGAWNLVYSPDFSDHISTGELEYGVVTPDPYRFVWDVTPYVKPGPNKVQFYQTKLLDQPTPLALRNVMVEQGEPLATPEGVGVHPAPQGTLPVYIARAPKPVAMQAELSDDGQIRFASAGRSFQISTRTSLPLGAWTQNRPGAKWHAVGKKSKPATWSGPGYKVSRRIEKRSDHLRVFDTISNTGRELAGVMIENRLALPVTPKEVLLAGRPRIGVTSFREQPAHPTALAWWGDYSVGLVAEDDVFRTHHRAFSEPGAIGLSDPRLGIAPGQSHTLEWSIYPQKGGDYWSFINALRRNWGSNYKMQAATFDTVGATTRRPEKEQHDWVTSRNLAIAISPQTEFTRDEAKTIPGLAQDPILSNVPPQHPVLSEGTAIPMARSWNEKATRWMELNRGAKPPVRSVVYIHANICSEPGAADKYADSKVVDAAGKHLVTPYFYPLYLYLPTLESSYGKALMETVKYIVDDMKADGLYMDEFSFGSVPAYIHYPQWDGCTVEIDPTTHAVKGKVSSSVLLQQPWREAMLRYLRSRNKVLLANSFAATRTANRWQVQFFIESLSYSSLIESHLGSPWGLANHNPDQGEESQAQMTRGILDYGGLPCFYLWPDAPSENPSFSTLMYPTTPEQIGAGMVLGRERIVTKRSGRYGWPDGRGGDVYVFDGAGKRVHKPDARPVAVGKKTYIDLRMPSDHFAILVKR